MADPGSADRGQQFFMARNSIRQQPPRASSPTHSRFFSKIPSASPLEPDPINNTQHFFSQGGPGCPPESATAFNVFIIFLFHNMSCYSSFVRMFDHWKLESWSRSWSWRLESRSRSWMLKSWSWSWTFESWLQHWFFAYLLRSRHNIYKPSLGETINSHWGRQTEPKDSICCVAVNPKTASGGS